MRGIPTFIAAALVLTWTSAAWSQEPNAAEARLREGLKNTVLQLRAAEVEKAALQAAQAKAGEEKNALETQLAAMTKQGTEDQEKMSEMRDELVERANAITRLNEALEKWKKAHAEVTAIARKKETERASAVSQNVVLQRKVEDQQRKNAAMFKIGNEILSRYEKFGLGHALTAREPFIGTTRVKLQNLMQEYDDQLRDEKIRP